MKTKKTFMIGDTVWCNRVLEFFRQDINGCFGFISSEVDENTNIVWFRAERNKFFRKEVHFSTNTEDLINVRTVLIEKDLKIKHVFYFEGKPKIS